jgi:hypothetical protein
MQRRLRLGWVVAAASIVCSGYGRTAQAAAPGSWSLGVERLFGISRATSEVQVGNVTVATTSTSVSLFSALSGRRGYSTPRLTLDYLASSGLTVGGGVGYESRSRDGSGDDESTWLFLGRIGYFALPGENFGIWPRAGLTHLSSDVGAADDESVTALTLEVPLVFLILGRRVGLTLTPHADIGIASSGPGDDDVDRKLTELGFQFGINVFF